MSSLGSVTGLFNALCSSDPLVRDPAAHAICNRFTAALLALCSHSLSQRLRAKADPDDLVQSAFAAFFARQTSKEPFDLKDRDALWNLLVTITLNKARNLANHYSAGCREVNREQPQEDDATDEGGALPAPMWMLARMDRSEPTPAEAALLKEEFELRLASLPEDLRQIALCKLEGCTNLEIAEKIGRVERTVENQLSRIRRRWMMDQDSEGVG
jgi:RNA polymerase sigma factor (sigma-70 family)